MPEPERRTFADRTRAARIFCGERAQHLPVRGFEMLHIERGVQSEIVPLLSGIPRRRRPRSTYSARVGAVITPTLRQSRGVGVWAYQKSGSEKQSGGWAGASSIRSRYSQDYSPNDEPSA